MIDVTLYDNYCLVEPDEALTRDDFHKIAEAVDPIIERQGGLHGLLIKTKEFPGWESFGGLVEHLKFVKAHHQSIKKVALVTDAAIAELLPSVVSHFVSAEVKHFDFDDYDEAVDWVS